jgi:hypothetical protein
MLDLPRYLLGVAELLLLGGFALLGGSTVRRKLLPRFSGPPAWLATAVIALALLIWTAELLGSFALLDPGLYLAAVAVVGAGLRFGVGAGRGGPSRLLGFSAGASAAVRERGWDESEDAAAREGPPRSVSRGRNGGTTEGSAERVADTDSAVTGWITLIALAIATAAAIHFAVDTRDKLLTGMTGFDTTWYHGPFAAGFFQSGNTWRLHFIAPQFLAWFYPANAELFHAAGMLAFGRDLLSPLLNLGWFLGCLPALWCIGSPYRVAPWSLALGAIALSLPVLSDQAGEARNDIVGIFFLLAAVAVALNARREEGGADGGRAAVAGRGGDRAAGSDGPTARERAGGLSAGALAVVGLAAGLAAGTKLNFLLPAAVLVVGLAFAAPRGSRWRALWISGLAALAGGGYWYLRNLVHTGNPLPWFDRLGPISLPAPEQALGGREGHSVLGYLTDGGIWSDWFLPGLHQGLTIFWPLSAGLALAGLALAVVAGLGRAGPAAAELAGTEPAVTEPTSTRPLTAEPEAARLVAAEPGGNGTPGGDRVLAVAAFAGLAAAFAWLIAPTAASGPTGMPRGFESGLRYLAPAFVLGLTLLPVALKLPPVVLSTRLRSASAGHPPNGRIRKVPCSLARHLSGRRVPRARAAAFALALLVAIGYPIQRHYLRDRYATPTFAAPGLNAAFKWANSISGARIATTGTRQYPLYGRDLSNHVQYIGVHTPHGGFIAPTACRRWRTLLNAGHYDYVIATRDRFEPGKPRYPPTAAWTAGPSAEPILSTPPTKVYKLTAPLDPSACSRRRSTVGPRRSPPDLPSPAQTLLPRQTGPAGQAHAP